MGCSNRSLQLWAPYCVGQATLDVQASAGSFILLKGWRRMSKSEQIILVAGQEQAVSSEWESDCLVAVSNIGRGEPAARLDMVVGWCPCPGLVTSKFGLSGVIIISSTKA